MLMRGHWSNRVKISIDGRRYLLRYLTPMYRKAAVGAGTTEKLLPFQQWPGRPYFPVQMLEIVWLREIKQYYGKKGKCLQLLLCFEESTAIYCQLVVQLQLRHSLSVCRQSIYIYVLCASPMQNCLFLFYVLSCRNSSSWNLSCYWDYAPFTLTEVSILLIARYIQLHSQQATYVKKNLEKILEKWSRRTIFSPPNLGYAGG